MKTIVIFVMFLISATILMSQTREPQPHQFTWHLLKIFSSSAVTYHIIDELQERKVKH
jgi:hypothetical protein